MSLLVWMPLNGNLTNQGLGSLSFSANSAEYSDVTKFNKSLNLKTANVSFTVSELANQRIFSIAFWIYCQSNSSYKNNWNAAIRIGDGASLLRFESTYSSSLRGLSFHNNDNYKITSASRILAQDKDKWYHVALVCDGTKIYSYTDGVNTFTDVANGGTLNGAVYINHKTYYGFMNDLRIYDHALSNKEVEELSKGLCCHYPLNAPYCTASVNKYSGDTFEGKPSSYSTGNLTMTKLADERGYNFKLNYKGTGADTWPNMQYPVCSFTAGKTYDYSCKVRVHSSNLSWFLRASRVTNDWVANMRNVSTFDKDVWTEIHLRTKLEKTSERAGSTLTTAPLVEFYSESLKVKDKIYTFDIDIKDVQFAECESDAPATNGAFADTTVYDTSGFGNDGKVADTSLIIANDSPRYNNCTEFSYKKYITGTCPFGSRDVSEFTISTWAYQIEGGAYSTFFNSNGYGGKGVWLGINTESCLAWLYRGITPNYTKAGETSTNTWHLLTLTYKDGVATWYADGNKITASTYTDKIATFASGFTLGDSYTGSTWNTNFHGKLSDFRIYAKALSTSQVMELYNTPVSISNNGTLITKGEFVE